MATPARVLCRVETGPLQRQDQTPDATGEPTWQEEHHYGNAMRSAKSTVAGAGDHLLMCLHQQAQLGNERCRAGEVMIWAPDQHQRHGNRQRPIGHSWLHADGSWLITGLRRHQLPTQQRFARGLGEAPEP